MPVAAVVLVGQRLQLGHSFDYVQVIILIWKFGTGRELLERETEVAQVTITIWQILTRCGDWS